MENFWHSWVVSVVLIFKCQKIVNKIDVVKEACVKLINAININFHPNKAWQAMETQEADLAFTLSSGFGKPTTAPSLSGFQIFYPKEKKSV